MDTETFAGVHRAWNRTDYSYDNHLDDQGNPAGGYYDGLGLQVRFQNGPIGPGQEANGSGVENLTQAALQRMAFYQDASDGRFACHENARIIYHLSQALAWMEARTEARKQQGVEGMNLPHHSEASTVGTDETEQSILSSLDLPAPPTMTGRSIHPDDNEGHRRGAPGVNITPPDNDGDEFKRRVLDVMRSAVRVGEGVKVTINDIDNTLTLALIEPSRVFAEDKTASQRRPGFPVSDTGEVVNQAWILVRDHRVDNLAHAYNLLYEAAYGKSMEFQNNTVPQSKSVESKRRQADRTATYVAGRTMAEIFDWKTQRDQE